jgi:Transposase DDE domain
VQAAAITTDALRRARRCEQAAIGARLARLTPRERRRWIVERFFAWIQWRRRLLVRWEHYLINFLGFVQLAAICVLLRHF